MLLLALLGHAPKSHRFEPCDRKPVVEIREMLACSSTREELALNNGWTSAGACFHALKRNEDAQALRAFLRSTNDMRSTPRWRAKGQSHENQSCRRIGAGAKQQKLPERLG